MSAVRLAAFVALALLLAPALAAASSSIQNNVAGSETASGSLRRTLAAFARRSLAEAQPAASSSVAASTASSQPAASTPAAAAAAAQPAQQAGVAAAAAAAARPAAVPSVQQPAAPVPHAQLQQQPSAQTASLSEDEAQVLRESRYLDAAFRHYHEQAAEEREQYEQRHAAAAEEPAAPKPEAKQAYTPPSNALAAPKHAQLMTAMQQQPAATGGAAAPQGVADANDPISAAIQLPAKAKLQVAAEEPEEPEEPEAEQQYDAAEEQQYPTAPSDDIVSAHVEQVAKLDIEDGKGLKKRPAKVDQQLHWSKSGELTLVNDALPAKSKAESKAAKRKHDRLAKYYDDGKDEAYEADEPTYAEPQAAAVSSLARPSSAKYSKAAASKYGAAALKKAAGQPSSAAASRTVILASKKAPTGDVVKAAYASDEEPSAYEDEPSEAYEVPGYAGGLDVSKLPNNTVILHQVTKGHVKGKSAVKAFKGSKQRLVLGGDGKPYEDDKDEYESKAEEYERIKEYKRAHKRGGKHKPAYDTEDPAYDDEYDGYGREHKGYYDDMDQSYYWDPYHNGQGSKLRKKEARNVYNFRTTDQRYSAGLLAPLAGPQLVTFTYSNVFTCGLPTAPQRVGSCTGTGTAASQLATTAQLTLSCTIDEDATNLCGLKYVPGMVISAQGTVAVEGGFVNPELTANMLPITGVYVPNRRTTLLADVVTLLSGVKGGTLMLKTGDVNDKEAGSLTFYLWR